MNEIHFTEAFSYSRDLREDVEVALGLRQRRTRPPPPRFRIFRIPFTITHEQMRAADLPAKSR